MKKILGLLMVVGLLVSFVGCGGDKDSPTGPSEEITEGPQGQDESFESISDVVDKLSLEFTVANSSGMFFSLIGADDGISTDVNGIGCEIYLYKDSQIETMISTLNGLDTADNVMFSVDNVLIVVHSTDQEFANRIKDTLKTSRSIVRLPTALPGQTLEVYNGENDDGNKIEYQFYRDGGNVIPHGYYKEYYESGAVMAEARMIDGKSQGKATEYYESGGVLAEVTFVDGKKDGKWVGYYEDGQIRGEGNYKDGMQDGKWVWYYESGKKMWDANYKDGKKDGKWVGYDEAGNADEDIYENDVCVEKCEGTEP